MSRILVLVVVVLMALAGLWISIGAAGGAGGESRASSARVAFEAPALDGAGGEREDSESSREASDPPAETRERVLLSGSELRKHLEAVARAEHALAERVASGVVDAELRQALEDALEPILLEPVHCETILSMLLSGELAPSESELGSDKPSLAEYGGVRALYWALLTYTAPHSELYGFVDVDPSELVMAMLAALPMLDERIATLMLRTLSEARMDGVLVLDHRYLKDILYLRSLFPEHAELFSALLTNIGETMSPAERDALFSVLLDERADLKMVAVTLANLLRGENPGTALIVAESLFQSSAGGPEAAHARREAIAMAVAKCAPDPYDAVDFLTARADITRNMLNVYWQLATREDASAAMEAKYHELAARDADARARYLMVLGLERSAPERMFEIAAHDSDAGVRGQALRNAFNSPHYAVGADSLATLETYASGDRAVSASGAVTAARILCHRASKQGNSGVVQGSVEFLRRYALDERLRATERGEAVESLKPFVDAATYEALRRAVDTALQSGW